ncbi:MAG TPA: hypothetical protein VL947_03065, partial [Cytophagales bacterium]|nr:hypothetical protein [Cytophagales bacterium]
YEKIGIWQLGESAEAAKYNRKPGEIKIKDQDNNGVIDSRDRKVLGSNVPKFSLGLNNTFRYKAVELSFYWFARVGQMVNLLSGGTIYDQRGTNNSADVGDFDYWTPTNPTNNLPKPNRTGQDAYISTTGYHDGSFLKLRSVNISYNVPVAFSKKYFRMENLKVYATGRNLFTATKIRNYDPEMNGGFTNPLVRLYTVGINAEF